MKETKGKGKGQEKTPDFIEDKERSQNKTNNKQGAVIRRTGSYRLSRVLRRSTIGDKRFNVRVRNGIGWDTLAITTSSSDYCES